MTDKEIVSLLNSLLHSEDLKLKVNVKEGPYDIVSTATLTYKGRKIITCKNTKPKATYE